MVLTNFEMNPIFLLQNGSFLIQVYHFFSIISFYSMQKSTFSFLFDANGDYNQSPIKANINSFFRISDSTFIVIFLANDLFVTLCNIIDSQVEYDNFTFFTSNSTSVLHLSQLQLSKIRLMNSNFR